MSVTIASTVTFEASANLQKLIGRELVSDDPMAVIELVKNAYDSGATSLEIVLQPESHKEPGYIEFKDNGSGMNLEDIKNLFVVAGYSERTGQSRTSRVPTGEKGIGVFASDKLGSVLDVKTRKKSEKNVINLTIDWERFSDRDKKFNQIKAPYKLISDPAFGRSGTVLTIRKLRGEWNVSKIQRLRDSLSELLDPFHNALDFSINLQVRGSAKFSGPIIPVKPGKTDIELTFKVTKAGVAKRSIKNSAGGKKVTESEVSSVADTKKIPGLIGRIYYSVSKPSKEFTKGLSAGVRLYRDGFRIEPFGSSSADWLGIAEKRAKRAGHAHIVPTRIFGFIEISRREQKDLVDVTSRQALLENDAARALVTFLKEQIAVLEGVIRTEVAEPRWEESTKKKAEEFHQAKLHTLNMMSVGLAHELRQPLQVIKSEASNIAKRLRQLGIKDPMIIDSQENIDGSIDRIDRKICLISDMTTGNFDSVESIDLAKKIDEECENYFTADNLAGIEFEKKLPKSQIANTNPAFVSLILINLLVNAHHAISTDKKSRKGRISISLTKIGRFHVLDVADNGPGIPVEIQQKIFKNFSTRKTGGMGVGLYFCNNLLQSIGGDIDFATREGVGTSFTVKFPDSIKK